MFHIKIEYCSGRPYVGPALAEYCTSDGEQNVWLIMANDGEYYANDIPKEIEPKIYAAGKNLGMCKVDSTVTIPEGTLHRLFCRPRKSKDYFD